MVNPRKAYPIDMGLIPVFDPTGRANLGHALETAVLLELERRTEYFLSAHGGRFRSRFPIAIPRGVKSFIPGVRRFGHAGDAPARMCASLAAGMERPGALQRLISLVPETPRDIPGWHHVALGLGVAAEWARRASRGAAAKRRSRKRSVQTSTPVALEPNK